MPEVPAVLETENVLIKVYQDAWERVIAQQQALIDDPLKAARRARLAEMRSSIESIMDEVEASSRAWIQSRLPQLYATGGTVGAEAMGASEFLWSSISQEAVEEMAFRLMDDVLAATKHVNATTKGLIRAIAREEGLQKLIEGKTAVQAGREMSRLIAQKGISAIKYSNGAKHGLADYGEMLARTTTAKAYNIGILNGAAQNGCQFWEVFDGPGCGWSTHDSGEIALGKIVTRDEALAFPISHPRCRRSFGPRPDLTSNAPGQDPEKVAAQRAQDQERAARQERTALRRQQKSAARTSKSPKNRVEKRNTQLEKRKPVDPNAGRFGKWGNRGPNIHRYDDGWKPSDGADAMTASLQRAVDAGLPPGYRGKVTTSYIGEVIDVAGKPKKVDRYSFVVDIFTANGKPVGHSERIWREHNGKQAVYNSFFEIEKGFQGQGIGSGLLRELDNWYIAHGVDHTYLNANIDVGGYAWARAGYDWNPNKYKSSKKNDLISIIKLGSLRANVPDPAAFDGIIARIRALDVGDKDFPTPFEISQVGWTKGAKTWPGKEVLLESSWEGVRVFVPPAA